jgi:hypothetical protein
MSFQLLAAMRPSTSLLGGSTMRLDNSLCRIKVEESRRYQRVGLTLPGRYMLPDQREYLCSTVDVSANGLAVESYERGVIGEHVIAYINELGRVEGMVVRQLDKGFAIAVLASACRIEKLIARINWLAEHQLSGTIDSRRHERVISDIGTTVVMTPDGGEHSATLVDVSSRGAALNVQIAPPLGSSIRVGKTRAHVVRHFAGGIAVTFQGLGASGAFLSPGEFSAAEL